MTLDGWSFQCLLGTPDDLHLQNDAHNQQLGLPCALIYSTLWVKNESVGLEFLTRVAVTATVVTRASPIGLVIGMHIVEICYSSNAHIACLHSLWNVTYDPQHDLCPASRGARPLVATITAAQLGSTGTASKFSIGTEWRA